MDFMTLMLSFNIFLCIFQPVNVIPWEPWVKYATKHPVNALAKMASLGERVTVAIATTTKQLR